LYNADSKQKIGGDTLIVWALFDSGNGCYKKAVQQYFPNDIEIYSIGLDIENQNQHFIHMNLASYGELFGESQLFCDLDKLPKPDIILASPPCESWSVASGMKGGNVCWYSEELFTLFGTVKSENSFTLRTHEQLEEQFEKVPYFKKHWWKTVYNRINGELCAFNIIRIIERYQPKVWVIENPQSSRLWRYYKQIQGFQGIENIAHYNAYNKHFPKKPTTFYSNHSFALKTTKEKASVVISKTKGDERSVIQGYNARSNIPLLLIKDILQCSIQIIEKQKNNQKRKD